MIGPLLRTSQQHPQYDNMVRRIINSNSKAEKIPTLNLQEMPSPLKRFLKVQPRFVNSSTDTNHKKYLKHMEGLRPTTSRLHSSSPSSRKNIIGSPKRHPSLRTLTLNRSPLLLSTVTSRLSSPRLTALSDFPKGFARRSKSIANLGLAQNAKQAGMNTGRSHLMAHHSAAETARRRYSKVESDAPKKLLNDFNPPALSQKRFRVKSLSKS